MENVTTLMSHGKKGVYGISVHSSKKVQTMWRPKLLKLMVSYCKGKVLIVFNVSRKLVCNVYV